MAAFMCLLEKGYLFPRGVQNHLAAMSNIPSQHARSQSTTICTVHHWLQVVAPGFFSIALWVMRETFSPGQQGAEGISLRIYWVL